MRKSILLILVFLSANSFAQHKDKIARIDSVLTYLHQRQLFNGTVLLGENGKVLYKKAFGISNAETLAPLTTSSAFNLASVSKQFYTMMTMILKERGKLNYDEQVQKYIPSFPYNHITIRHLMNQTSGLQEYFEMAGANMNLLDTLTNQSLMELLAVKKPTLEFQPGEKWKYCNSNYTTLASVIEKVSGQTADKFFQQTIAGPLKLPNTYVYNLMLKSYPSSRVFGLQFEAGKPVPNDLLRFDGIVGDGNVYSSAEDLHKWDQALYTEKLVKKSTFAEAITAGKLNDGSDTGYGFGWFINEPGKKVSHTGGWVGFRTYIVRYLDKNQTIILLDNSSNFYARAAVENIWEAKPYKVPSTQLITNVKVIDGTGLGSYEASVRILDNRIHDIGKLTAFPNENVTDGKGKVLAPGFIDTHSHHDWQLPQNPSALAATNQGITTIVVGQDGGSVPIDTILTRLEKVPVAINLAAYTGHGWLRQQFIKDVRRKATKQEIDSMKALLSREMDKGSLGLSTGLEYEVAFYSTPQEVIDLAKVTAEKGGRYISHLRSEDLHLDNAIEEIIEIGRQAKIPVQISHFKIALHSKWGTAQKILNRLEQARLNGIDITADVYPYPMWSSTPRVLFPKKDFNNLASAEFATRELFDPVTSVMVNYPPNPQWEGKTVSEIGKINNESPALALMRIIRDSENKGASIVATSMSETDISSFLKWPHSNICSDGSIGGHPRGHGAFTRTLGRYVREQNLMPLETAIQKMTSLAAEHVGIRNRGQITPGYYADLVLFDPDTIIDNATITDSKALSSGIEAVWVNGKIVYQNQQAVPNYSGMFIKR